MPHYLMISVSEKMASSSNILGMVGQASMVQESIEHAAMFVDQSLVADYNYVDLSDLLQVPKHGMSM